MKPALCLALAGLAVMLRGYDRFDIADDEYAASTQAIVPKGAARSAIAICKAPVRNRANPARRRQEE